ncbi:F420-non-reducing hydrogenase large subunit [Desulfatibacillum alkenivorans DSM 16219]|jgi:F420-non-reducing hydrogenase large subunit|uniref:F420-non-reducing hydrogenase large subunit n=1 Tax=Desulfatibacillum alkenivorans DSM 16219 TaxID=1121393 RepID=A0A1M6YCG2_9BACT|nr:Ni/Fe hydrogenase subunit alpha [Desulfatibacillum alkenivorans]SHL15991.1 F420-non-reducing hydrogenase large subunit [Desulfatibacillum alkenivorans DSM 16219]
MSRNITVQPITRIEGHASIGIELDDNGNVSDARVNFMSLRGFEKFVEGKPAEELPRIVSRICGICPWMHHLASTKAVEGCFGATPTPTGSRLRELMQTLAHAEDKLLHFFFLAAPDFVMGPDADYSIRNVIGIVKSNPELATQAVRMRQKAKMILDRFTKKTIHPVAGVPGGFCKPLTEEDRVDMLAQTREIMDFALFTMDLAKNEIFPQYLDVIKELGTITTGFLGTVDKEGALNLYDGRLRLMQPSGEFEEFDTADYTDYLAEKVVPFSYGKFPYARRWNEGFSLDPDNPKGIYRANTLARINVADKMATPRAQAELEEFRAVFGRPAQATLLYHYARLIEEVYACERAVEILEDKEITNPDVRAHVEPGAGRGVGCVEAPRGTLIHDYSTDENGLITSANLIVGTTHNLGPINLSVHRAAKDLIKDGVVTEGILNRIEMAVRAYDP